MRLREVMCVKIKFSYFFFIITVVLPIGITTISIPIFWWWIDNPYGNIILSPFWTIVGMYIWAFAFCWGIVAYMALPWLAVIREDRITFHRLFRRRLVIAYKDVGRVEFLCNHMPIENYRYGLGHLLFYKKNQERIFVGGVPHSVVIEMRKEMGKYRIEMYISTRNLTKDEIKDMQEGKIKK